MRWYHYLVWAVIPFSVAGISLVAKWENQVYKDRDRTCACMCAPYQVQLCTGGTLERVPEEVWCLTADGTSQKRK